MSPVIDPTVLRGDFNASLKVGWAKHHLRLMDKELDSFLGKDPKPYRATTQDDLQTGEYIIRFDMEPIPLALALMAGDFFACLRGSLDHLAFALTKCPGGICNERASFPIIGINDSDGKSLFKKSVKGVPVEAVNIIESFQPYHLGNTYQSSVLWILHRLWNVDKHRRLPLRPAGINLQIGHPPEVAPISSGTDNSGAVRFPLSAKAFIDLKPMMQISIEFGDESEGIVVAYNSLNGMYEFVRRKVIPSFERFF